MKRVLLAGPLQPFPGSEFYAQLLRSWARAFARRGIEVSLAQFGQFEHWLGSGITPSESDAFFMARRHIPWMGRVVERAETTMLCRHIREFQPDATVIISSWPEEPRSMVKAIRSAGSGPLFGWLGGPPNRAARNGRLLQFLAELDVVLVYDPMSEPLLVEAGVQDVRNLPLSVDTEYIAGVLGAEPSERDITIGFCGRVDRDRERYLVPLADLGLVVWTNSPIVSERLATCVRPAVFGPEMYRSLGRCRIGLNIHHPLEVTGGNSRSYEVPACGAVLLADDKPAVRDAFVADVEVILFDSPLSARAAAERLLHDEALCAVIGDRGRARVMKSHTVDSRIAVLTNWIDEVAAIV